MVRENVQPPSERFVLRFCIECGKPGLGYRAFTCTQINHDIVREFYANAMPMEGTRYTFKSYVRGVVYFTWDAISSYIGDPLHFPPGRKCAYARKATTRTWNIKEVASVLSFENSGFTLGPDSCPTIMDRGNMN